MDCKYEPLATVYENFYKQIGKQVPIDTALGWIKKGVSKEKVNKLKALNVGLDTYIKAEHPAYLELLSKQDGALGSELKSIKKSVLDYKKASEGLQKELKVISDLKNSLACILFSGFFRSRHDADLQEHSGYIILDFDKVSDPEKFRDEVFEKPYVRSSFLSPSGKGVKVLVRVPRNGDNHRGYFQGLREDYPEVDPSGINESRICYISYDEDIKLRKEEDTEVYEKWKMPEEGKVPVAPKKKDATGPIKQAQTDYNIVARIVGMLRNVDISTGRNNTLLKASVLAGGYITSGKVSENEIRDILHEEARAMFGLEYEAEKHTIENGIGYGRNKPIHELEAEALVDNNTHSVITLNTVSSTIIDQWQNGVEKGFPVYIDAIDRGRIWSRKDKRLTVIAAPDEFGKSEFMKQIILLDAIHTGRKSVVYSPEEDEYEFYTSLIWAFLGGEPSMAYVSKMHMEKAISFIQEHIYYVYPKEKHTKEVIMANMFYMISRDASIKNVVIDPVTYLCADQDKISNWLGNFYIEAGRFARTMDVNMIFTVHSVSIKKNKDGEFDPLTKYELAGGAMTSRMVHDLLVLHRPYINTNREDPSVELWFRKIKNGKIIGSGRTVELEFDRRTNRYLSNGISHMDNWRKTEQATLFEDYKKSIDNLSVKDMSSRKIIDFTEPARRSIDAFESQSETPQGGSFFVPERIPEDEMPF